MSFICSGLLYWVMIFNSKKNSKFKIKSSFMQNSFIIFHISKTMLSKSMCWCNLYICALHYAYLFFYKMVWFWYALAHWSHYILCQFSFYIVFHILYLNFCCKMFSICLKMIKWKSSPKHNKFIDKFSAFIMQCFWKSKTVLVLVEKP